MARKKETLEEKQRREKAEALLQNVQVEDLSELQALMKEMMKQVVEKSLEGELDDELGYTRYDYRQKETDNSRNGFSKKIVHSDMGDVELKIPRDRGGEF